MSYLLLGAILVWILGGIGINKNKQIYIEDRQAEKHLLLVFSITWPVVLPLILVYMGSEVIYKGVRQ